MVSSESFAPCSPAADTLRRVRLIRLAQRALRAYETACCLFAQMNDAAAPEDLRSLAADDRRCKHCRRRYLQLKTILVEATGLPDYSVFNAITRAYPFLPARLLVSRTAGRIPRPARCGVRLLVRARQHRGASVRRRDARFARRHAPVPYIVTCAGMELTWPGTPAKEGAIHA